MMRPLTAIRSLLQHRPKRVRRDSDARLRATLAQNEMYEDVLTQTLGRSGDPNAYVDAVLRCRDQRVEILHGLGWHREADELAADTAMRRSWPPIDTTPILSGDWIKDWTP